MTSREVAALLESLKQKYGVDDLRYVSNISDPFNRTVEIIFDDGHVERVDGLCQSGELVDRIMAACEKRKSPAGLTPVPAHAHSIAQGSPVFTDGLTPPAPPA